MEVFTEMFYIGFSAVSLTTSLFASIHVAQRVALPLDKAIWLTIVLVFPLIGAAVYFFSKYQRFRGVGKGGIVLTGSRTDLNSFFQLNETEKDAQKK